MHKSIRYTQDEPKVLVYLCEEDTTQCWKWETRFNPLKAELNPIRHFLALVGAPHIVHVSRVRVKWYK